MGAAADHPVYLYSYVDDDGAATLVEGNGLARLIQEGRLLSYGYWRPCMFNELSSMHRSPDGFLLTGISGDVDVSDAECEADPGALLDRWLAVTAADRTRDMADREEAVRRRAAEDAAHSTRFSSGPKRGQTVGNDAFAIRMALQERAGLSHGRDAGEEGGRKVIARLVWLDGMVVFQSTLPEDPHRMFARGLTWAAPVNLDRIARAWMEFVGNVREELGRLETFEAAKTGAGRR